MIVLVTILLVALYRQFGFTGPARGQQGGPTQPKHLNGPQNTATPAPLPLSPVVAIAPQSEGAVDVHLLVIWSGAMTLRDRILTHVAQHFHILDVRYFDWGSPEDAAPTEIASRHHHASSDLEHDYFLMNLWRLYSGKGGGAKKNMPLKVRQCGRGPFIGIVVVDPNAEYRTESTAHGDDYVNHHLNDAKKLYRKWTGGGFKVHGTFNPTEAPKRLRCRVPRPC
jgi:hypothetical protein